MAIVPDRDPEIQALSSCDAPVVKDPLLKEPIKEIDAEGTDKNGTEPPKEDEKFNATIPEGEKTDMHHTKSADKIKEPEPAERQDSKEIAFATFKRDSDEVGEDVKKRFTWMRRQKKAYWSMGGKPCFPEKTPKDGGPDLTPPQRVFELLENVESCRGAIFMSVFIMGLILLSTLIYLLSTMPEFKDPNPVPASFTLTEFACMVVFVVEYLVRFLCVPFCTWEQILNKRDDEPAKPLDDLSVDEREELDTQQQQTKTWAKRREKWPCLSWDIFDRLNKLRVWLFQPFNIIDNLAVVPYFVLLAIGDSGGFPFLRILRLARIFRVFKAGKYADSMTILTDALSRSAGALYLLLFLNLLWTVVAGSLIYEVEMGTWSEEDEAYTRVAAIGHGKEPSPYMSIPQAFYWVVTTMTTTGYGDLYPTTTAGKCVAIAAMIISILFLSMPIVILSSEFSKLYEDKEEAKNLLMIEKYERIGDGMVPFVVLHIDEKTRLAKKLTKLAAEIRGQTLDLQKYLTELQVKAPKLYTAIMNVKAKREFVKNDDEPNLSRQTSAVRSMKRTPVPKTRARAFSIALEGMSPSKENKIDSRIRGES